MTGVRRTDNSSEAAALAGRLDEEAGRFMPASDVTRLRRVLDQARKALRPHAWHGAPTNSSLAREAIYQIDCAYHLVAPPPDTEPASPATPSKGD